MSHCFKLLFQQTKSLYSLSLERPPWCALFCDSGSLCACPATHVNFCLLGGITTPPYWGGSDKERSARLTRREMTQRHHVTRHMTCPYSIGPVHIPACYRTRVLRVRVGNGVRGTEGGKIPLGYATSQNFTQFSTAPTAPRVGMVSY